MGFWSALGSVGALMSKRRVLLGQEQVFLLLELRAQQAELVRKLRWRLLIQKLALCVGVPQQKRSLLL